jgi:hypothetical protein
MRENIRWSPDGHMNAKFNPRATTPKTNALKIKSTSNIQAIK